ncbi:efflux RND transporter periplasmic adaptor subunit [Cesiribacter andamanensis]|uniref:Putative efflux pump membrane fusion protein n=1 Tax=Cesiribacter andamanensis AMV16 TaxID=1279009 RepID=M7N250_9BACT|nr:HlyD family efflux transporter periplasmic adaptor subunit [Cesiribacter andamanensis]EMR02748.1 putative efflux pump membrane fusion protein [Cesiribacter andamanensis AMV16]
MDRVIQKKTWNQKRILTIVGIAALVILISASVYFANGKSRLNVAVERITISEVRKNTFQEFIPVNGTVQPIATIYLDALEGGRVEEKLVEDGSLVQKGQPILRLSNTDLELSLANQETAVFQVLTQMQNTKNGAVQNSIQQLNQKAEVDNALAEAKRVYELNQHLYKEGVIGQQEFKASENNYTFQLNRKKLNERTLTQDSISMQQQLRQTGETYARMQNTLALMRRKVEDLIVRAPIDGQLTSLDAEIGESKNKGSRLGQIDVMSGFKVQVEVDEHYISRVFIGQQAEASFAGKKHALTIKKVYSQVRNGRFQVDMEFVEGAPEGIRRGQTLQIRLALSDETQAVLLAKGGFYQQTGGNWVFKVSEDGSTAYRVDVQLGRQNPEYYEVLSGLQPGDKVVTSSYENWGDMQELVLK